MKPTIRLRRMLKRLNVDYSNYFDLNMRLISQAAAICQTCPRPAECEVWLRSGKQDQGYRAFCPNAARLDCLMLRTASNPDDRVA